MSHKFGATPHAEIARAFEAEHRQHTFVEAIPVPSGGSGGTVTVHIKKYELRLSLEELLTLLDALSYVGDFDSRLATRQLRRKILATLGLFEDG